jgi:hypothetical protein
MALTGTPQIQQFDKKMVRTTTIDSPLFDGDLTDLASASLFRCMCYIFIREMTNGQVCP